jgi:excisionase family DNA binding protein
MSTETDVLPEALWTVAEVAKFFRCSTSIIYKRVARGDIPCVRFGALVRFDPRVIRDLISGGPSPDSKSQVVALRRE